MKGLVFFLFLATSLAVPSTPEELILEAGYPCEEHTVPTEDGYALNVQRIPRPGAPAVYLQHGLLDSSGTWLVNLPNQSLAYVLYDAGYDVWLGNQRGNRFSRTMANASATFRWDFSIDEMARYDDAALLKYVTQTTGRARLTWIGHSRGTQQMFYGLAAYPDHAQYLNLFVALGPVAFVGHAKVELLNALAKFDKDDILDKLGYHDFVNSIGDVGRVCLFCSSCCGDIIGALVGPGQNNPVNFNQSRDDYYTEFAPAGTSSQEMAHYAQLVLSDQASYYDFGERGNIAHYGSKTAPLYNLSHIPTTVPIALLSGALDYLADPQDVARLAQALGSRVVLAYQEPTFNHMSFTWGINAAKLIYKPFVLPLIKKYNV